MTDHTFGIIGAGPGGLQLGYYLQQSGQDYLILDRADEVGAFWRQYPRSRELISFNRDAGIYDDPELKMRWDWNSLLTDSYEHLFPSYSDRLFPLGEEVLSYLADFAKRYELRMRLGFDVRTVAKDADGRFVVTSSTGQVCRFRYLVVATGLSRAYLPEIPGIELTESYETVPLEPAEFKGQRVLIIGKGNSAFEVANSIIDRAAIVHLASPTPVQLAWRTRHSGHVRAQYTRILDSYQLKTLHSVLDCTIEGIERVGDRLRVTVSYVHADGEREVFHYDRVIRCTGFQFDDSIFEESIRPRFDEVGRHPRMTPTWESVDVPNLFFGGTLSQGRDFKQASSAFIAGFRYNVRTLHRLLLHRHEGRPLETAQHPMDPDVLADTVLRRVSGASALWIQFGYLCDAIVLDPTAGTATYYEELPREYVLESGLEADSEYFVVDFEWGSWSGDVFAIDRHPRHDQATTNVFVHPIVRFYRGGQQLAEHHVLEDLLGMYVHEGETGFVEERSRRDMRTYHREEHAEPLRAFFADQLGRRSVGEPLAFSAGRS
ncbi:MAG: NAD(P)-binding domain-containing protein [Mycobacteriales bacterium]